MRAHNNAPLSLGVRTSVFVLTLAVNATVVAAQPGSDARPKPDVSRAEYELLRADEDWSFLEDRSRRTDPWDPVKFIPLRWPEGSYVSLGGEVRQQYERFANEEWGAERPDRSGYLLQRYMFHGDVRLGRRVRLFGQAKSGIETGRTGGPRRADEDRADLHQGYVELDLSKRGSTRRVSVLAGRQELSFGSSRLVSVREGANVRQSFDAVRGIGRFATWRVDVLVGRPVITTPDALDDRRDLDRALWAVYALRRPLQTDRGLDVYYIGYERRRARFDQGIGPERRHSVGARIWGQTDAIDYNTEAVVQWGSFSESRIRAWTIASDTGYRVPLLGSPRVGLRADVTSGDRDRNDETLGTFNPLFPRGAYFGLIAPTGPLNHMDLHPSAAFRLQNGWSIAAGWLFFWRTQRDDGLYSVPGNLLRSGEGSRARFVGQSPGLEVKWQVDPHLSFTADVSAFSAGAFLREVPPSRTITYFAAWTTCRF